MTIQILRPSSIRLPVRGPRRPVSGWLAWALIAYVLYLGLVLPFVCWGAVGTPGHVHPVAHFVFAPPTITPASANQLTAQAHGHPTADPSQAEPDSAPVGQSRPNTTLISLILLVFVGAWLLTIHHPRRFSRLWTHHGWRSIVLPIPTPPPRSLDFGLPILDWVG